MTLTTKLTPRQRSIWQYMLAHQSEHNRPPTIREIGRAVGITSPNGVVGQLTSLGRKGYCTYTPEVARGWFAVVPLTEPEKFRVERDGLHTRVVLAGVTAYLSGDEVRCLVKRLKESNR